MSIKRQTISNELCKYNAWQYRKIYTSLISWLHHLIQHDSSFISAMKTRGNQPTTLSETIVGNLIRILLSRLQHFEWLSLLDSALTIKLRIYLSIRRGSRTRRYYFIWHIYKSRKNCVPIFGLGNTKNGFAYGIG